MLNTLLEATRRHHPDRTAIAQGERRISYAELAERVDAYAAHLAAQGFVEGDRLGVVLPNVPEFVVAFFALARIGAVAAPANTVLSVGEVARSLLRLEPKGIVAGPAWCERLAPEIEGTKLVAWPGAAPETAAGSDATRRRPQRSDVLIQASSGSTGLAKWVCRTQANLVAEAEGLGEMARVGPCDVILGAPPLFHSHGLCNGMLAAVRAGATLVLLDRGDADDAAPDPPFALRCGQVLSLIEQEGVTIFPGVPFIFDALAVTGRRSKADLSTIRLCFSAGNFLPKDTFRRFLETFGIEVRQLYGCTEAGAVTLNTEPTEKAALDSVGRVIPGMELRVDADGEIQIRSAALGRYLEGEMRKVDGWFATGDLGRQDERGRIWITGRTKLLIDSGGHKVDPLEVEGVLGLHPDVREAAVVGVAEAGRGEQVRAFVVLERPVEPSALIAHCREHLAGFKIPRRVEVRESLPKSALGKLLRGRLMSEGANAD